jgi:hypothetical protein
MHLFCFFRCPRRGHWCTFATGTGEKDSSGWFRILEDTSSSMLSSVSRRKLPIIIGLSDTSVPVAVRQRPSAALDDNISLQSALGACSRALLYRPGNFVQLQISYVNWGYSGCLKGCIHGRIYIFQDTNHPWENVNSTSTASVMLNCLC